MPSTRRVNWEASPASEQSLSSLHDELITVFQNPSNLSDDSLFPPMKSDITIYLLYLPLYFPYQIFLALLTNLPLFHLLLHHLISNPSLFYPKIQAKSCNQYNQHPQYQQQQIATWSIQVAHPRHKNNQLYCNYSSRHISRYPAKANEERRL